MVRNRDRGLSNTLYWFFEVWNTAKMENYLIVLKVNLKKIANTSNSGFCFTQTGNRHAYLNYCWYLRLPICLRLFQEE